MSIKQGDILVCEWGATMSLVEYWKVTKVSPKTVVAVRIKEKTDESRPKGFLSRYVLPVDELVESVNVQPVRLYPREGRDGWFTKRHGFKQFFYLWDGEAKYENHAD